jgi:hypothetical protein
MTAFSRFAFCWLLAGIIFHAAAFGQQTSITNVSPASGAAIAPVVVTVTYYSAPPSPVVFSIDGSTAGSAYCNGGTQTWTTPTLSAGTHTISVRNVMTGVVAQRSYAVIPPWDWTQDISYDVYYNTGAGITHNTTKMPWYNNACPPYTTVGMGAYSRDKLDFEPAYGWSLVYKDFGSPSVAAAGWPMFVLYNRYTGLMRVFFWNDLLTNYVFGMIAMNVTSGVPSSTPLFTNNDGVPPFADSFRSDVSDNSTLATVTTLLPTQWGMADFKMGGYDPSISGKYLNLTLKIYGVDTTDISLAGNIALSGIIGSGMNSMAVQASGPAADVASMLSFASKEVKNVSTLWNDLSAFASSTNLKGWDKAMKDLLALTSGGIPGLIPGIEKLAGLVNNLVGTVTGSSGGGNQASAPTPIALKGSISFKGVTKTIRQVAQTSLPIPGSAAAGNRNGTGLYGAPLGLVNVTTPPRIGYYAQVTNIKYVAYTNNPVYAGHYDVYGIARFGLESPVDVYFNQNAGMNIALVRGALTTTNGIVVDTSLVFSRVSTTTYRLEGLNSMTFTGSGEVLFASYDVTKQGDIENGPLPSWGQAVDSRWLDYPVNLQFKFTYLNSKTGTTDTTVFQKLYPATYVFDANLASRPLRKGSESENVAEAGLSSQKPTSISIGNYPNPFNPSTRFEIGLPEAAEMSLILYDVLGREVTTLILGHRAEGTHLVTWDAHGLSTGVYFARLVTVSEKTGVRSVMMHKILYMK